MHTNRLKIVGCGGHGKVVIDALLLCEYSFLISFCDSNKEMLGHEINGILVDSTMESLSTFSGFLHLAIGNNQIRKNIIASLNSDISLLTIAHPSAVISKSAFIEEGSFIAARAILGPESYIGRGSIINHGAVVDHEVSIGECSHIAPNSTLGGRVRVGQGVLIGAGAIILPGVTIGDGATIAAGAVVLNNVKDNMIVMGIPAKEAAHRAPYLV